MKKIALILSLFTFFACENPSPNTQKEEKNTTNTQKVSLKYTDLEEKVFEIGEKKYYIADSCKMTFECDCCADALIFNKDSTFYYQMDCMGDYDIFKGKYEIQADKVTLHYAPLRVTRDYTTQKIDTITLKMKTDSKNDVFSTKYCANGRILLKDQQNEAIIGVATEKSYKNEIETLQKQDVLKYFKK
jgi:hypothetical protein